MVKEKTARGRKSKTSRNTPPPEPAAWTRALEILSGAHLLVRDTRISLITTDPVNGEFVAAWSAFDQVLDGCTRSQIEAFLAPSGDEEPSRAAFREVWNRASSVSADVETSFGGGFLHKTLHKTLHKGLHKSLHKGLHKSAYSSGSAISGSPGLDWPTIEVPWRELGRLYDYKDTYHWDEFSMDRMPPAPPIKKRLRELKDVRIKQEKLRRSKEAFRRERIVIEATNDLTAYMLPLGADVTTPSGPTALMFQTILWLGSLIGLLYKERFNAPRPHVLDPSIEPFIPVPAYSSYPSNHAFQSFLIAEVFARAVPEHPGVPALCRAAEDVAVNREWAGLHIASDTEGGRTLAFLCAPMFEDILVDQIRDVRREWLGEGEVS